MSEPIMIMEVNAITGETVTREMTAEELQEYEVIQTEIQARQAEQEAKAAARASALAKLAELGLTEEEVAAL